MEVGISDIVVKFFKRRVFGWTNGIKDNKQAIIAAWCDFARTNDRCFYNGNLNGYRCS